MNLVQNLGLATCNCRKSRGTAGKNHRLSDQLYVPRRSEADLRAKLQLILANPELLNGIKRAIRNQVFPLIEEEAYLYARLYKAFSS